MERQTPLLYHPEFEMHPLTVIVGGTGESKTTLIKNLIYDAAEKIAGMVVFTNSRNISLRKDYDFLNSVYVRPYSDDMLEILMQKGAGIVKNHPDQYLVVVFDDCSDDIASIGLTKKTIDMITRMRKYNIAMITSGHGIQSTQTTMVKNNATRLIIFRGIDSKGMDIVYKWVGQRSLNLHVKQEFHHTYNTLQRYFFLTWDKESSNFVMGKTSVIDPFRLYMKKEDLEFTGGQIIFGNKHNFDWSKLEYSDPFDEIDDINPDDDVFVKDDSEEENEEIELSAVDRFRKQYAKSNEEDMNLNTTPMTPMTESTEGYKSDEEEMSMEGTKSTKKTLKRPSITTKNKRAKAIKTQNDVAEMIKAKNATSGPKMSKEDLKWQDKFILMFEFL